MRCPYCGGLNPDNTSYCARCGRSFAPQPVVQRPSTQSVPPQSPVTNPRPAVPQQAPPYQGPSPVQRPTVPPVVNPRPTTQPQPARSAVPATRQRVKVDELPPQPANPSAPEPPAPFPPRTIAQLKALIPGALEYTLVDDTQGYGKKKIVRIIFRRCAAWQQIATLLKALQEYDVAKFDSIIIQGVQEYSKEPYDYTNGQIAFDRNVRLGSHIQQRYQVETENGVTSSALRIVLSEDV